MNPTPLLIMLTTVLFVWCIVLTALLARQRQFLTSLSKGVTKKDLLSLLKQIIGSIENASNKIEASEKAIDLIRNENKSHLQKIGFVRFNPFADTGGDQSFCLCLLDKDNNGIVVTSLHSRQSTRLYAKQVVADTFKREDFSEEELHAYQQAEKRKSS